MNLQSVFTANGAGIFILLIMHYTSRSKILRTRTEDRLFSIMMLGVMLGCLMEAFSYALDGHVFTGARAMNYAANTYLFTANLLLPFCVLMYVDLNFGGSMERIKKNYRPQIAVGVALLIVNVINFFVPLTFYITDMNVYERRPIGYVYYAVILYYCISSLLVTRRYEKENGAKAFVSIRMFLIPILIGAGLQFMFYGLSLAWLAAAIGLTGLYMMQMKEMAYIDPLAGIYNRQYLNRIMSSWIGGNRRFAGVMSDVDYFKSINDRFGHSEGDQALKDVTDMLKAARKENEWIFRFAGDEFIVLKLNPPEDGMTSYMNRVEEELDRFNSGDRPYRIGLSYGMAIYDSGDMDSFMKEMDSRMYEMKAEHHREAGLI